MSDVVAFEPCQTFLRVAGCEDDDEVDVVTSDAALLDVFRLLLLLLFLRGRCRQQSLIDASAAGGMPEHYLVTAVVDATGANSSSMLIDIEPTVSLSRVPQ